MINRNRSVCVSLCLTLCLATKVAAAEEQGEAKAVSGSFSGLGSIRTSVGQSVGLFGLVSGGFEAMFAPDEPLSFLVGANGVEIVQANLVGGQEVFTSSARVAWKVGYAIPKNPSMENAVLEIVITNDPAAHGGYTGLPGVLDPCRPGSFTCPSMMWRSSVGMRVAIGHKWFHLGGYLALQTAAATLTSRWVNLSAGTFLYDVPNTYFPWEAENGFFARRDDGWVRFTAHWDGDVEETPYSFSLGMEAHKVNVHSANGGDVSVVVAPAVKWKIDDKWTVFATSDVGYLGRFRNFGAGGGLQYGPFFASMKPTFEFGDIRHNKGSETSLLLEAGFTVSAK